MKRLGDTFETAECVNCGELIQHVWWGDGGTLWEHEDGRSYCYMPKVASPVLASIVNVEAE